MRYSNKGSHILSHRPQHEAKREHCNQERPWYKVFVLGGHNDGENIEPVHYHLHTTHYMKGI